MANELQKIQNDLEKLRKEFADYKRNTLTVIAENKKDVATFISESTSTPTVNSYIIIKINGRNYKVATEQ